MSINFEVNSLFDVLENQGTKVLVYGPSGAGKTVLCASTGAKTLFINAESGLLSIKTAIRDGILPEAVIDLVDFVTVNTISDLVAVYQELKSGTDYKWVCLDSITEIAEVLLSEEKEEAKDPRQAYGALIDEMTKILKKFRDLPGYNIVMSCKQQRVEDTDTGRSIYCPLFPGSKLHQQAPYLFDEVWALRVEKDEDNETYRILQTQRDSKYEAKSRSGLDVFEEPSLYAIQKKIDAYSTDDEAEEVEEVEEVEEEVEEVEEDVNEQDDEVTEE